MKDMTKVTNTMLSEEEKTELDAAGATCPPARLARPTSQRAICTACSKSGHGNFRIGSGDARSYIGIACTPLVFHRRHTQFTDLIIHVSRSCDAPSLQEALQADARAAREARSVRSGAQTQS